MGEPYLTHDSKLSNFWLQTMGELAKQSWLGFLGGLYAKPPSDFTCHTTSTFQATRRITEDLEQTRKDSFFLTLASIIQNTNEVTQDIRQHCELDNLISDIIFFCNTECGPQKLMSRVATNMEKIGSAYKDLVQIMYGSWKARSINEEIQLCQRLFQMMGKIVRVSVSFDRLEWLQSDFMIDDEDFD